MLPLPLTSHVGELLAATLQIIAVLGLNSILNSTWHGVVDAENRTLNQLNLTSGISAKTSTAATALGTTRRLALAPGLCGRRFTPSIRGGDTARHSKGGSWALGVTRVSGPRIRILVRRCRFGSISFGQAVTGGRANGGDTPGVRVVKGCRKGTLLLMGQKSPRGIIVLTILITQNKKKPTGSASTFMEM